VFKIRADGTGTGTGTGKIFDTALDLIDPAWSPNGRRIALYSDGPASSTGTHPRSGIWTVNPDGTSRAFVVATPNSRGARGASWQPLH
jgi:Tol biopolymer transport system component